MKFNHKHGLFWEARTRILAWYFLLMAFFVGLSIPLYSQLALRQVDERVEEDLQEEIDYFQNFIDNPTQNISGSIKKYAETIFNEYLLYRLPEDETYLITTIDGKFHRSSPSGLPDSLRPESVLFQRLVQTTTPQYGTETTSQKEHGDVLYRTQPLTIEGETVGILIIGHTTAGEYEETLAAISLFIKVLLAVSVLALILGWLISEKVLTPVRALSGTARLISETDLDRRIEVRGSGEMADLAVTFNAMMDRLQNAFASQRAFINDAGHELRTPITIIQGHLELMGNDPQEQHETVELVLDELERMSRLVEDLLLLSKSERPDFLQRETLYLDQLTEELFTKAQGLANRNWQLESLAQGSFRGDRQRLTQAIMNLADNATHYTKPTDTIAIGSSFRGSYAYIWVRDTGAGIAINDRKRIFERFDRGTTGSRQRSEGAGLGLSIVRAIAQAHGGRVELRSQVNLGSTFTLVLPIETPSSQLSPI